MKRTIAFVTIASGEVGMGHLMRSLSLAEMLQEEFNIKFIIDTDKHEIIEMIKEMHYQVDQISKSSPIGNFLNLWPHLYNCHIVVLDFYGITKELQLDLKEQNFKFVCIDDLHDTHFYADAIINVSNGVKPEDYSCERNTKLYLGTDFALLRSAFLEAAILPQKVIRSIDSVFINMGGADLPNNTLKFLRAILKYNIIKKIHIVIGIVNPYLQMITDFTNNNQHLSEIYIYHGINSDKMKSILLECQLAICPASGISIEICAIGIGIVTGFTAENQKDVLKGLIDRKCAFNLGDFNLQEEDEISASFGQILTNIREINEMVYNQKVLIDGQSPRRLKDLFIAL
ncbi:UDP-2,4-diacetamido-2,4,6-trideoxy-beta-L-altropyranose hydrolase [Pedobacter hiemivivus]|uniref:UDP-2,4-diacetamido-2,4, 6-trideoxy-beta-L-altropyranose hydrolase n=1 Tax=Pedobacter hiemivivus TaxID=2530454 RepID=A0A4V5PBT8_9SPHI|nr:UDP-2,4-diacetamido-2,4,6-trideoxy-beta-L-altropyranose hydrolase [Pedobacter hiemivivus]TKC56946.1 UDP-2,4-diacetamido-2,4,6-trideoxy-beta-L-altropyranose hydrolase [Pedobacter hiemivivus]